MVLFGSLKDVASGNDIHFNALDTFSGWKHESLPPVEVPSAAQWKFRSKPFRQVILDYDCGSDMVELDSNKAVADGILLKLPFVTIFEYLQMLKIISSSMRTLGPRAMFYLAAAVSDFYVPWKSMVEHKIQSASGPLDMRLMQNLLKVVIQMNALRVMYHELIGSILSGFDQQLETDSKILLEKAIMALKKYKMNAVVANELLTRKEVVTVVTDNGNISVHRDKTWAVSDVEDPLIDLFNFLITSSILTVYIILLVRCCKFIKELWIRGSLKFQTYLSSYLGTMMMFDEMGICGDMDFFSAPLGEKDVAASQIEPEATVEDDYSDEEIDVDEL
ncbi:hypothetical protein GOBAR_DD09951 [Gossypium barbadense]|nr:hypothetical protein GOBAR_DD09951 [Gossypium barbadense]